MKKLIIFICNGNIHRSVIAAECLRKILKEQKISSKFSVASYGLQGTKGTRLPKYRHLSQYPKEWKAAQPTLQRLRIDISKHSFQKVSAAIMKKADVVIAMDNKVYKKMENSLIKQFPKYTYKIHSFSELTTSQKQIKDPSGNESKKLHRELIENIYSILKTKYNHILQWIR